MAVLSSKCNCLCHPMLMLQLCIRSCSFIHRWITRNTITKSAWSYRADNCSHTHTSIPDLNVCLMSLKCMSTEYGIICLFTLSSDHYHVRNIHTSSEITVQNNLKFITWHIISILQSNATCSKNLQFCRYSVLNNSINLQLEKPSKVQFPVDFLFLLQITFNTDG